jgi:hypothetical protein
MANEGEYPKIDGDVLYASEINKVSKSIQFFAAGSTVSAGSSTEAINVGSVVIPGGTFLGGYSYFDMFSYVNVAPGAGSAFIGVSGIAGNGSVGITIDTGFLTSKFFTMSDSLSYILIDYTRSAAPASKNGVYGGGFNVNLGSDLVIFLGLVSSAANPSFYRPYIVNGFGKIY